MKVKELPMSEIRILKIGSCPSISGRSSLTYNIGCKADSTLHLRICENTGRGVFNKDWIPLTELDPLLTSAEKPITAGSLRTLFQGKSANTTGFIMAVLIAEGLLKVSEPGCYVRIDPSEFKKGIQALIESSESLSPPSIEEKPAKVKKTATKIPVKSDIGAI
jgi:hypothetical protein